ncbi:CubicO group peptidase, beta-lactamase class C family [Ruminococcaceae bacterium YAD3003]|nr:CubicO group peptidase, beta-lactamase class C family [Ruminococcaceae bacterium YAD3003]
MFRKIVLSFITAVLVLSYPVMADSGIEGQVDEFRSQTKCGNVSVVIYDHGEITYYGDSEGLYQIGSMTKSFTGLGVQKLIGKGEIKPDDKVSDLIPGFTSYYDNKEVDLTVENLLTQKSGYTNSETDYPSATESMTLTEWAMSISGKELKSMPGTEYAYSNVNYNLLGLIIENTTGMSYREYMESEVLVPLNLDATSVGTPEDTDHIITGSRLGFRNTFEYEVPVREASIPAGYFYSNTDDIGTWMTAWIEGTDTSMDDIISGLKTEGDYYAGWERFADGTIGHSGGTPNYSSRIVFSREQQIGVCVLTNLNVASTTDSLCNNIFAELTGKTGGGLICDVWTVFDIIFTSVSVLGIALFIASMVTKKKGFLIGTGSALLLLSVLIFILFPVIFGAGFKEIAFVWAPWSFITGFIILVTDVVCTAIKLIVVKADEGRTKTG